MVARDTPDNAERIRAAADIGFRSQLKAVIQ
jgi:hypothetical protein